MIQDKASLKNVRDSWKTVRVVDAQIATNMNAGIFSLVPTATGFSVVPESLLLVFAVAVLEEVLVELEDQGTFYSRKGLKRLMEGSQSALPWQDFAAVNHARERRNDVAHKHQFLDRGECRPFLDAIEREFIAWKILDGPVRKSYTVSLNPT